MPSKRWRFAIQSLIQALSLIPIQTKIKIPKTHVEYVADSLDIFLPAIPTGPQLPLRRDPLSGGSNVSSGGWEGISSWEFLPTIARAVYVVMQALGTHTRHGAAPLGGTFTFLTGISHFRSSNSPTATRSTTAAMPLRVPITTGKKAPSPFC